MTFAELKTDVFRRLDASASAAVFFSASDVEDALNEGLMELADETEFYETSRVIDLLAGRPYYDLRTLINDREVLTPGRAFNLTTNRWLDAGAATDFDRGYRQWERVGGQPQRIQQRGLWWVGYWPIVAEETGSVKQYVTALPDALEDDTDEPDFEAIYHEALVLYALSILWPQMGEVSRGLEAWQGYLAVEAAMAACVGDRGQVPQPMGLRPS